MMTVEEAGEEYLLGEPFILCAQCNGTQKVSEWQGSCCSEVFCRHCTGGYALRPAFQQACQKLKLRTPTVEEWKRGGNWRSQYPTA